jgi:hypothetical protein
LCGEIVVVHDGIALAGAQTVARVEVGTDETESWQDPRKVTVGRPNI